MIVIKMHVHAGEYMPLKVMLDVRELLREIAYMVIVHEGDRADRLTIIAPLLADEHISDHVAEGFRSIRVPPTFDVPIELQQQLLIQGHAESHQLCHASIS
jgi:hypothetical protein